MARSSHNPKYNIGDRAIWISIIDWFAGFLKDLNQIDDPRLISCETMDIKTTNECPDCNRTLCGPLSSIYKDSMEDQASGKRSWGWDPLSRRMMKDWVTSHSIALILLI